MSGMRFLDYRFSLKGGKLLAYHGIQNEYCTAEEAFGWIYDFLGGEGKGETVVISVKQVRRVRPRVAFNCSHLKRPTGERCTGF